MTIAVFMDCFMKRQRLTSSLAAAITVATGLDQAIPMFPAAVHHVLAAYFAEALLGEGLMKYYRAFTTKDTYDLACTGVYGYLGGWAATTESFGLKPKLREYTPKMLRYA